MAKAQRVGALKGDGRFVWKEFRPAYRWMRRQMAERLGDCRGQYPVWAWLQPKPDLRRGGHLPQGMIGVRLEFIVPAQEVLLSDFSAWHMVLNDGYLALSEGESDAFYERHSACCETTPRPATPSRFDVPKKSSKAGGEFSPSNLWLTTPTGRATCQLKGSSASCHWSES